MKCSRPTAGVKTAALDGELDIRPGDAEVETLIVVVGVRVVAGLLLVTGHYQQASRVSNVLKQEGVAK